MEAIYSTEELVELGYKTEDALAAAAAGADEVADSYQESLRVTEEFKSTTADLEAQLTELQDAYIGTALQSGKNSDEAKALQKEIGELSKVIDKNKQEFSDLEKESGAAGATSTDVVKSLEQTLVAAGITKLLADITAAVMEMANEFSEAQSIVVKSTGATGAALDDLSKSMMNVYAAVDDGDIKNTAAAIGEVNVRLGLQGAELENVGELFMMYADNTNTSVVPAIQSVSKVMKNWNVEVGDTESLLDKSATALIMKLDQLSAKTDLTAGEQQQMSAIVDKLNKQFPDLALSYDNATRTDAWYVSLELRINPRPRRAARHKKGQADSRPRRKRNKICV